jgi:integrase
MKAMILLAANCGFGNADVATLPTSAIDMKGGWVNFPRPKTGIPRRIPLWPETIKRLKQSLAARPEPKDPTHAGRVFVTKYGKSWHKTTPDNPVSAEFRKLLNALDMHREGLGSYAFRHTFDTVGGGAKDQVAVNAIMGHVDSSMAAAYRERIDDEWLVAVVEHVRGWLFVKEGGAR